MRLLSVQEENNLSIKDKINYYNNLRKHCEKYNDKRVSMSLTQRMLSKYYRNEFYNNNFIIEGEGNIPLEPAIYMLNHSNGEDCFAMDKGFTKLGVAISPVSGADSLTIPAKIMIGFNDSIFIDRNDKVSSVEGMFKSAGKILGGKNVVFYGEAAWNLHPIKPMLELKRGAEMVSLITGAPIVPVNMEYIESTNIEKKELDMYKKIIFRVGKAIEPSYSNLVGDQTSLIKNIMEKTREKIWNEENILKNKISDIDPMVYINHTWLKKFGRLGFTYNSEYEALFLRGSQENEYTLNENGILVPGITLKKSKNKRW